ncbi:PREDICTED: F-box/kelch-repeat protein At3g23880-like [Erythranthe guttata]|nr:PREDICTED: F-box/kelch-repeat protein At3g23880-like [Erythranthe guttata]|eukprot:XP_012833178.1 PREDICTED: F-box/kelch-repeat protein At3g23880-like [Erythranthe guttata]
METKPSISDHQPRIIRYPAPAETYLEDHIEEILSRLPVKSLLRFRCVSKSWRALISSKRFIKAHLEHSRKDTTNFTRHVIVSTSTPPGGIRLKHCSLPPLFCGLVADSSDVDFPITNRVGSVCIRGNCNGLVCVVIDKKHIYLWNPSTRKFKEMPHADADVDSNSDDTTKAIIGFGFDESNEDYKVLAVFNVGRDETNVKIYSLRTNSWKIIDVFKDGLTLSETGTL